MKSVVTTYEVALSVPCVDGDVKCMFNSEWGFVNGIVNRWNGYEYEPVDGAGDREYVEAFSRMCAKSIVRLRVTLYVDGTRNIEFIDVFTHDQGVK